jgi:hypothetical protein
MKLIDYPGLFGKWPPPAHDPAGNPVQLDHCHDALILAFHSQSPAPKPVQILTSYQGVLAMREITVDDEIFARVLCEFLNKQRKKSIGEIGELDVTFFG